MRPAPLLVALLAACGSDTRQGGPGTPGAPNDTLRRAASGPPVRFALEDRARTIVRIEPGTVGRVSRVPVLRARDLPREWAPIPEALFGISADSFDFAVPSPGGDFVAWQGGGIHSLLGVVPGQGGKPRVLDFFFDSQADAVEWAEAGPYLLARYTGPSGYAQALVYDAGRGARLRAPWDWDGGCPPREQCEITDVRWAGPTTLAVTAQAPSRAPRSFTADIARLEPREAAGGEPR